jgi:hypothetical protein
MFDTPIDAWYAWLGLSVASLAVFGVVTAFPTAPAPDAAAVAGTIDRIATADYDATASRDLDATAIRLGPRRIGLRNDAGAAHATLAYPVVPVRDDARLARVLRGTPPGTAFPSTAAFERAVTTARERGREPRWRPAGGRLTVRRLGGGVDVTLVGTTLAGSGRTNATPTEADTHDRGQEVRR